MSVLDMSSSSNCETFESASIDYASPSLGGIWGGLTTQFQSSSLK